MLKKLSAGLTMIELLIVVGLLAVFITGTTVALSSAQVRSRDAQRKRDLEKIKISFEDYYNDNGCYPDADILDNCQSGDFAPYLKNIPCDPQTKQPYDYQPNEDNQCAGYRLLAELQDKNDPDIVSMPCAYNYGVSVGEPLVPESCEGPTGGSGSGGSGGSGSGSTPTPSPSSAPSPSPSPTPPGPFDGPYACDGTGQCNVYADPAANGCPNSYATVQACDAACLNPANYCN